MNDRNIPSKDKTVYVAVADILMTIGWRCSGDAQWHNLRDALPRIEALLNRRAVETTCFKAPEGVGPEPADSSAGTTPAPNSPHRFKSGDRVIHEHYGEVTIVEPIPVSYICSGALCLTESGMQPAVKTTLNKESDRG